MSLENKKEKFIESKNENIYVKNSKDYGFCNHDEKKEFEEMGILTDSECLDLLDNFELEEFESAEICKKSIDSEDTINSQNSIIEEDLDELALLGFFNEFTLMDIGMADFIREVYFED